MIFNGFLVNHLVCFLPMLPNAGSPIYHLDEQTSAHVQRVCIIKAVKLYI